MIRMTTTTDKSPAVFNLRHAATEMRQTALKALARMFRPGELVFAFRLRREQGQDVLEGISRRYTAIALIGLADEPDSVVSGILAGQSAQAVCNRLLDDIGVVEDLGDVALTLWAARALRHPRAAEAVRHLRWRNPVNASCRTVELAWSLTALVAPGDDATDEELARALAGRLIESFHERSGLFPHWPRGSHAAWLRAHVSCFADLVYPIQALSHYHRRTGDMAALAAARQCADRICRLQGPGGQWWWHYDVRTGRVIERYPVYAVHQDGMAPMALLAIQDASGMDYMAPISHGMAWLARPPEIPGSLIDPAAGVIWRKVARHEPHKLVRRGQALVSRLHPALRLPGMDWLFRARDIDFECRPYHMGWILHAWSPQRLSQLGS